MSQFQTSKAMVLRLLTVLACAALAACGDIARLPPEADEGPNPTLPPPAWSLIPTVNIASAQGWPEGAMPTAPVGFQVTALARGLDHPRWVYVLPNGDVLVAESNKPAPPPDQEPKGIKAWVMKKMTKRAGADVPSADRITLLRDSDGDGVAETRSVFIENLHSPFGMALVGSELYVANADAIVRFPYATGQTRITAPAAKVTDLPAGINHHWTKNIIASRDGSKLYATVGSNSNVAEKGLEIEEGRAAIWEIDRASGQKRLFASGLRNPNGLGWEPATGALWTVVNERDELGSDLVPDYLTSVKEGAFYGWPWSYWGRHVDERVKPARPDLVAKSLTPDYALGNHVAAAGPGVFRCAHARAFLQRRLHRRARLLEPQAPQRLQGELCSLREWQALGPQDRFPQRLSQCGWQGLWPPGRRGTRPARRLAGGRRRGQCGLAGCSHRPLKRARLCHKLAALRRRNPLKTR